EDLEQLFVADLARVVFDLDRFGVTGAAGADLVVARVLGVAAGVADGRRDHPRHGVVRGLHTPEAATGERRLLVRRECRGGERDGEDEQRGERAPHDSSPGTNLSATPLLHQRCPVGGGPSSNTCPWCPPQRMQWYSVRGSSSR